jgi:hypothetical protein
LIHARYIFLIIPDAGELEGCHEKNLNPGKDFPGHFLKIFPVRFSGTSHPVKFFNHFPALRVDSSGDRMIRPPNPTSRCPPAPEFRDCNSPKLACFWRNIHGDQAKRR